VQEYYKQYWHFTFILMTLISWPVLSAVFRAEEADFGAWHSIFIQIDELRLYIYNISIFFVNLQLYYADFGKFKQILRKVCP